MDVLYKYGMLSLAECTLIKDINNQLSDMSREHDEGLWTLKALKESNLWEQCREKAGQLLTLLYNLE